MRLPIRKRILFKIVLMGHRLVHHPQRVPDYLNLLVSRNGQVINIFTTFKLPTLKTAFVKRSFSFAVPCEWNRLPFKSKFYQTKTPSERSLKLFCSKNIIVQQV